MNQWAENIECILPLLGYPDPNICSRKDTCLYQNKCQIGGALQAVLEIPYRFPKAILIAMDMQAQVYQYLDYIGRKDSDRSNGFTDDQYKAMLRHYGANEGGQSGKALSIKEGGLVYPVYKTKKPNPFNFIESPDDEIKKHFEGEKAYAIPIPWGGDVVPVLIVFLKNEDQVVHLQNFIRKHLREIQLIVKDTRKESLGKLVSAIPDGDKPENDPRGKFSRWLLGWLEERDGLWLGNKLWFVVDHGLIHAKNIWKLANELADENVANLGNKLKELNKMNPLIFSLAIWLHDIGYKGIHLSEWEMELMDTRPDHIINNHGIISAALILKQYQSYNLNENEFDEMIRARASLVCAYHQKENPITITELEMGAKLPIKLTIKNKNSFVDEMINKSAVSKKGNDEYLILENLSFRETFDEKSLKVMASLLRFLDSCDFNRNRVGSPSMIKLRKSVCDDNASPQIPKFRSLVNSLFNKAKEEFDKSTEDTSARFNKAIASLEKLITDRKSIPENMEDEGLKALDKLSDLFTDAEIKKEFECTYYLGRYVGLLNQQVKYYEVHNFVVSVSFKENKNEKGSVSLEYKVDKEILSKNDKVKSSDTAEKEIRDFISKKAKVVYEKILKKDILEIRDVKFNNDTRNFDDWIKNEDDK